MRCLWIPAWVITIAPVLAADTPPREISFFDSANRFLDRDPWANKAPAKLISSTTVIDSFEDWSKTKADWLFNPYHLKPESTAEHATDGQSALEVTFVHPGDRECVLVYREGTSGWGNPEYERKAALSARVLFNDEVRLDVFNPGDPVTLLVTVDDKRVLRPGRQLQGSAIQRKKRSRPEDCRTHRRSVSRHHGSQHDDVRHRGPRRQAGDALLRQLSLGRAGHRREPHPAREVSPVWVEIVLPAVFQPLSDST